MGPIPILVVVLMGAIEANARINFREYKDASDEVIAERVEQHDPDAIRELGYRDLKGWREKLARLASEHEPPQAEIDKHSKGNKRRTARIREYLVPKYKNASLAAKMALAKRGDRDALRHFIMCLSTASDFEREACIQALGYIGDKRAVKHLIPILSEKGGPKAASSHILTEEFSETAAGSLERILPTANAETGGKTSEARRAAWLNWWKSHEEEFREGVE